MLAVAVQLAADALATDRCGIDCRARWRSELEPEPEASAGAASMSTAQLADTTDLMLITKPLFSRDERGEDRQKNLATHLQDS